MKYEMEVSPLAALEIIEGYDWYEEQRFGLGLEFLDAVDAFFNVLLFNPQTFSFLEDEVRQGSLKRFPYVVVYEIFKTQIVVYSVFHASQNPYKKRTI
jgi:toxin ParE1/3/4